MFDCRLEYTIYSNRNLSNTSKYICMLMKRWDYPRSKRPPSPTISYRDSNVSTHSPPIDREWDCDKCRTGLLTNTFPLPHVATPLPCHASSIHPSTILSSCPLRLLQHNNSLPEFEITIRQSFISVSDITNISATRIIFSYMHIVSTQMTMLKL